MATFEWNGLTIVVGEMSRTQALECSREFDALAPLYADAQGMLSANAYVELLREADGIACVHAPAALRIGNELIVAGERTIERADELPLKIALPLTRESFNALPTSLTEAWVSAVVKSNNWFVETLKKTLLPTMPKNSEPKSDSGQSNGQPATVPPTTTTGG